MSKKSWDSVIVAVFADMEQIVLIDVQVTEPPDAVVSCTIPEAVNPQWLITFMCSLPMMVLRHYADDWHFTQSLKQACLNARNIAEQDLGRFSSAEQN